MVETPDATYVSKGYREADTSGDATLATPSIPAWHRAEVAKSAQAIAAHYTRAEYQVVPALLADDETGFIMEAVPQARQLFGDLQNGHCPETVVTDLAPALARFHNATRSYDFSSSVLGDTRFRDYKLQLQYYDVARYIADVMGDPGRAGILHAAADHYKKRRQCVVHGDPNPKNVLISGAVLPPKETAHLTDFEQAHWGSPAYDLAYVLSDLFIASLQFRNNPALRRAGQGFAERYLRSVQGCGTSTLATEATVHLGAQVIYRFTGPSREVWTAHVDPEARQATLEAAKALITATPRPVTEVF